MIDWHPFYQSCQRFFLDHAQHEPHTLALADLMNICLPYRWPTAPLMSSNPPPVYHPQGGPGYNLPWPRPGPVTNARGQPAPTHVSLIPYIRRLVICGFDSDGILHGFFGDDWRKGVGAIVECERRNYLFTAKSVNWVAVKEHYDMTPQESVPFMKPLQNVHEAEIESAEKSWSRWLAMQDWMLGPRSVDEADEHAASSSRPLS